MVGVSRDSRDDVNKALLTEIFPPPLRPYLFGMVKATENLQKEDTPVPDVPRKFVPCLANVLHVDSRSFSPLTSHDLTTTSSL